VVSNPSDSITSIKLLDQYFIYTLVGLLTSLTVVALLVNANSEQENQQYKAYMDRIDKNEAQRAAIREHYTAFDALNEIVAPQSKPRSLQGHWRHERNRNSLLHINSDGQLLSYEYSRHKQCYEEREKVELVYFGDKNMIVKEYSHEMRYHYSVTYDGSGEKQLNTQMLLYNSMGGETSFTLIDPRAALDLDFCDAEPS